MSEAVVRRLARRIDQEGPLPFEVFQHEALYGEGGFFAGDVLRSSRSGDFLTSPEVSSQFGETLARFVAHERRRVGASGFVVVDAGAGSGSLLAPLLAAVEVEGWAVEASPPARGALAQVVGTERVVAGLDELPDPVLGVIVANELIDNLPVALAVRTAGGWEERWVGRSDEAGFALIAAPVREPVRGWLERYAGPVEVGGLVEVQLEAARWFRAALARLRAGCLLVVDYGDTAAGLAPRRAHGTLRTYRAHHLGPDPLSEPGATDITSDVNFTALVEIAAEFGAVAELVRQEEFLAEWGLRKRLSELRRAELAEARNGDPMERLRLRTLRTEAETLLHPRGLGDFRVLSVRVG